MKTEKNGATQIELCADLANDGLTPDYDLIKEVKSKVKIPVKVMIRPRAGNFVYTIREINKMIQIPDNKIEIIAAGKITNENLEEVQRTIKTSAYHGRQIVGELGE
jgi:copper homeostasis protein